MMPSLKYFEDAETTPETWKKSPILADPMANAILIGTSAVSTPVSRCSVFADLGSAERTLGFGDLYPSTSFVINALTIGGHVHSGGPSGLQGANNLWISSGNASYPATTSAVFSSTGALDIGHVLVVPLTGYERYAQPGWDGEGAEAISAETLAAARRVMLAFPDDLGQPDVAPAADGTIGLEWLPEAHRIKKLFLDVGPKADWHIYWRLADGKIGEARGNAFDPYLGLAFRSLLDRLKIPGPAHATF